MPDESHNQPARSQAWTDLIPADQWAVYERVINALLPLNIPFALGGAFAIATYTGMWRNTKDLDIYVRPADRQAVIDLVIQQGLLDYFDVLPYDRNWIYRSHEGEIIIDIIWSMPNQRTEVDDTWLAAGRRIHVRGLDLRAVPAEEMIWGKIYVLQKDRSDWTDILNLIHVTATRMDWHHLIDRLETDAPLLGSVLLVFAWLDPDRARQIPASVWQRLNLGLPQEEGSPERTERRAARLDSRPWFVPLIPGHQIPDW